MCKRGISAGASDFNATSLNKSPSDVGFLGSPRSGILPLGILALTVILVTLAQVI